MEGAEWLARSLRGSGVSHFFFVDAVLRRTLLALERVGVQPVLAHAEKSAAYMADGYARIAGRPGVVAAQAVGAANLAAGLQDAFLGRAPVLALTGRKPLGHQHRNAYQELPHAPLFQAVTKHSAMVERAEDFPRQLRQAWSAMLAPPPRPAHLDLHGLMGEVIERGEIPDAPLELPDWRAPRQRSIADGLDRAAALLLGAKRVALVVGEGALLSGCGPELLALAEALQAPMALSLGARGIVPTRHPLHLGVLGAYAAPPANAVVDEAELVFFIGADTSDMLTNYWRTPRPGTRCIQLDADPLEFERSYALEHALCGDPKLSLAALNTLIGRPERDGGYALRAANAMREWRAAMAPRLASNEAPIDPARLCAEITAALPEDGILVADTGYSGIWTGNLVELNGAGQSYLRAAGSLGWSFPAALGAKCAAPHRKVVCFSGDGALYYHLTELETARRRGIAVVLVVNNNSGFGQGWPNYLKQAGNRPVAAEQVLRFGPTNFARVAEEFGVTGICVETPDAIGPALRRALAMDAPVVVDVATGIDFRAPEPWTPEN
ncbi:MAG TPA: thiamine pyrophosphate-binding protein [Roseococcus sp.]|jgi:acetolactate synthase-1/2/3 large subunit|nr:thiamine pyrophosphate-binding protein [Roseococcus sp.]